MPSSSAATEDQLDRVFHALANRTRRALLHRMSRSPAKITELAEPFAMSLPAVSKHLRVLERAGLIERDVRGRVHRCSLQTAALKDADEWLAFYRQFWDETLESLARHVGGDR